jgi:hypothetical protein
MRLHLFRHALLLPGRSFIYQFVVGADMVGCCLGSSRFFYFLSRITDRLY